MSRRILFIAFASSIHTARWIHQIADQGWNLYLFPSIDGAIPHDRLANIATFYTFYGGSATAGGRRRGINVISTRIARFLNKILRSILPRYREIYLAILIRILKPDVIHTLETQHAGYLLSKVRRRYGGRFPTWVHTNWGSDIYLFGRLSEHMPLITDVLEHCDYYSCECARDRKLALEFGFKGTVLPVFPNSGGFDLQRLQSLKDGTKPSCRKLIMVKGYQGWAGRALVAIRALQRAKELLGLYSVVIYSVNKAEEVRISAELLSHDVGIKVTILPDNTEHDEILKLHGQARISIGLSISDAISTSLLEAMAMGSFPIQSWTAATDEWFIDGKTGIAVSPEDPDDVERAIRRALTEDSLVDQAAVENWNTVAEKLDYNLLKQKTIDFYKQVFDETAGKREE